MTENNPKYERKITSMERVLFYSPFSIVTMVARIRGDITVDHLLNAVDKVQERHTNLRARIKKDKDGEPWLTTENVKEIHIEIINRTGDDHWIRVQEEASRTPFKFDERSAIRFILVYSPNVSELIILCHHVICDGLSLAYLARDLMIHLGDPMLEAEVLPDPVPIALDNLPENVGINPVMRFFINRINKQWRKDRAVFDQEDYKNINEAYWNQAQHRIMPIELTEAQTKALVQRCRDEKVTVNSALTTAFVGASQIIQAKPELSNIGIAGNLRESLEKPPGEAMGFFAGALSLDFTYDSVRGFWDNARRLNEKVQPLYTNKNMFKEGIGWCYLDSGILEAINFKKLGGLVESDATRYEKLSTYSKKEDVVSSILKREKMESLDKIIMGTAITNLTRMDFPRNYGKLELDRLIMNPGGAFPLSNINMVLGAVTCSGKLSLLMEYDERRASTETMEKIRDKASEFLLSKEADDLE